MHKAIYAVIFQPLVFCIYIAEVDLVMKINQTWQLHLYLKNRICYLKTISFSSHFKKIERFRRLRDAFFC